MALKLYIVNAEATGFEEISENSMGSPLAFAPRPGASGIVRKMFLRNDDETKYYTGLALKPVLRTGGSITGSAIKVKMLSGQSRPSSAEWTGASINDSALLESPMAGGPARTRLPEIGEPGAPDLNYYPIWVSVEASKGTPVGEFEFSFRLDATEFNIA